MLKTHSMKQINEQISRIKEIMGLNENTTIPGKSVWNHIISITPEEDNIPWGFEKIITQRKFKNVDNFNIESLLQSDPDFRNYYESNDERYSELNDMSPNDLHQEITIVDGELLDGYSRTATLLRKSIKTTNAFVAI